MQTFAEQFNPAYITAGNIAEVEFPSLEEGPRRYVAARALMECQVGDVINLGIGIPEGVAVIAKEENRLDQFTLTVEAGAVGGFLPAG